MAGKAFRRLIAEPQFEIVAMRTDQTHSALEFGGPLRGQFLQQRGLEEFDATVPLAASSSTASTPNCGSESAAGTRSRGQQLIRLLHLGGQVG